MSEINRNGYSPLTPQNGVLIDTYQVFDSCRDRDCFEDTRVFLDEFGQSLVEHTGQVRVKSAEICSSAITVEPVQLSRGFFRVIVRFYVNLELEACVCPGKAQSFGGIAVAEKTVVLYGGEGEVKVFRSGAASDSFCQRPCQGEMTTNLPTAVVEAVDPVILGAKVTEVCDCRGHCHCTCDEIPEYVCSRLGGAPVEVGAKRLEVSLGFFSVIRLERPEQYLISAVEFSVPDKECSPIDSGSPCDAFNRMAFPVEEFAPGRCVTVTSSNGCQSSAQNDTAGPGCGCRGRG